MVRASVAPDWSVSHVIDAVSLLPVPICFLLLLITFNSFWLSCTMHRRCMLA